MVNLSFNLLSIQELNEVHQTITLNAYMEMVWVDEQIVWNPDDYGGTGQFMVDSGRFWTPCLVLANTNDKIEPIGSPLIKMRFVYNGDAYYYPGLVMTVSCDLDIRLYPWDKHVCVLQFMPWGYNPTEYFLNDVTSTVGTSFYSPNGAWTLVGSLIEKQPATETITFYNVSLFLERKSLYVIVNVIIPVIVLAMLNLMVYFIPADSGERISFCITLLLAIAVFLTIVADNLPKSSTPMALFSYFLLAVLVVSNCITLSIISGLRLFHKDESEPVGGCWQRIVRVMKCQCKKRNRNKCQKKETDEPESKHETEIMEVSDHFGNRMNNSHSFYYGKHIHWKNKVSCEMSPARNGVLHRNGSRVDDIDDDITESEISELDENLVGWKDVSVAFDRICFIFFFLVLTVATTGTFGCIYVLRRQEYDSLNF